MSGGPAQRAGATGRVGKDCVKDGFYWPSTRRGSSAELPLERVSDGEQFILILDVHQQCRRTEYFLRKYRLGQETLAVDFMQHLISEPSAAYTEERNARREAFKGNRIQQ